MTKFYLVVNSGGISKTLKGRSAVVQAFPGWADNYQSDKCAATAVTKQLDRGSYIIVDEIKPEIVVADGTTAKKAVELFGSAFPDDKILVDRNASDGSIVETFHTFRAAFEDSSELIQLRTGSNLLPANFYWREGEKIRAHACEQEPKRGLILCFKAEGIGPGSSFIRKRDEKGMTNGVASRSGAHSYHTIDRKAKADRVNSTAHSNRSNGAIIVEASTAVLAKSSRPATQAERANIVRRTATENEEVAWSGWNALATGGPYGIGQPPAVYDVQPISSSSEPVIAASTGPLSLLPPSGATSAVNYQTIDRKAKADRVNSTAHSNRSNGAIIVEASTVVLAKSSRPATQAERANIVRRTATENEEVAWSGWNALATGGPCGIGQPPAVYDVQPISSSSEPVIDVVQMSSVSISSSSGGGGDAFSAVGIDTKSGKIGKMTEASAASAGAKKRRGKGSKAGKGKSKTASASSSNDVAAPSSSVATGSKGGKKRRGKGSKAGKGKSKTASASGSSNIAPPSSSVATGSKGGKKRRGKGSKAGKGDTRRKQKVEEDEWNSDMEEESDEEIAMSDDSDDEDFGCKKKNGVGTKRRGGNRSSPAPKKKNKKDWSAPGESIDRLISRLRKGWKCYQCGQSKGQNDAPCPCSECCKQFCSDCRGFCLLGCGGCIFCVGGEDE